MINFDKDFLQSEEWRHFQASYGRKTFHVERENFWANIIEHKLPVVGKYFYIPRGPVFSITNNQISQSLQNLVHLAKENRAGWIRVDMENEEKLNLLKKEFGGRMKKAPHDVQPKEVFMIDISQDEESILSQMKSKTRYNIRLAQKKNVEIIASDDAQDVEEFLRLVKITAQRDQIVSHEDEYYKKMIASIPRDIMKLYVAKFQNKIIAANLVIFYQGVATYLHGASDDDFRNVMAPYLLQWQQIKDAKQNNCLRYDFGGVSINKKAWAGITRFKMGFSPAMPITEFSGSFDIIINYPKYWVYRILNFLRR